MSDTEYTIRDLADEFNVSLRTIRFYEQQGYLRPARRGPKTRIYSEDDRQTLRHMVQAREWNFDLDEAHVYARSVVTKADAITKALLQKYAEKARIDRDNADANYEDMKTQFQHIN